MAFPTLAVVDSFNRADESPLAGGIWAGPIFLGENQLRIVTNQVLPSAADGTGNSYVNQLFGPDIEAYCTLTSAFSTSFRVLFYFRTTVGATVNGYRVAFRNVAGDHLVYVQRDGVDLAGSPFDITDTVASGDGLGVAMIGTAITPYWKAGAGAWTAVATINDSTYAAAGYVGLSLVTAGVTVDDFGGGTIAAAPKAATLRTLGSQLRW